MHKSLRNIRFLESNKQGYLTDPQNAEDII